MYFDENLRLPTVARESIGMKTTCVWCMEEIQDKFFIGAIKSGFPNMLLHELCYSQIEEMYKEQTLKEKKEDLATESFPSRIDSIE